MPFNYKNEYERYKHYYATIEPQLNKPSNQAYTAIVFSFLAVSLFGWYAIRPTMQTIFTLKREIADKTTLDKQMEDKISALIEAQAAYQDIQNQLPVLSQALPMGADPVRAVVQLQGMANDYNVSIVNATVPTLPLTGPQVSAPKPGALPKPVTTKLANFSVSLSVLGTYANVKNYLSAISDLRRIMSIQNMTFIPHREASTPQGATGSATLKSTTGTQVQVDLKIKLFYLSG